MDRFLRGACISSTHFYRRTRKEMEHMGITGSPDKVFHNPFIPHPPRQFGFATT